jgi:hypothetical protein
LCFLARKGLRKKLNTLVEREKDFENKIALFAEEVSLAENFFYIYK